MQEITSVAMKDPIIHVIDIGKGDIVDSGILEQITLVDEILLHILVVLLVEVIGLDNYPLHLQAALHWMTSLTGFPPSLPSQS